MFNAVLWHEQYVLHLENFLVFLLQSIWSIGCNLAIQIIDCNLAIQIIDCNLSIWSIESKYFEMTKVIWIIEF